MKFTQCFYRLFQVKTAILSYKLWAAGDFLDVKPHYLSVLGSQLRFSKYTNSTMAQRESSANRWTALWAPLDVQTDLCLDLPFASESSPLGAFSDADTSRFPDEQPTNPKQYSCDPDNDSWYQPESPTDEKGRAPHRAQLAFSYENDQTNIWEAKDISATRSCRPCLAPSRNHHMALAQYRDIEVG
jgi:hypothetical protein